MPHGFRSGFRDWAAEVTDHPREVAEAALADKVRNQIEAAYRRTGAAELRELNRIGVNLNQMARALNSRAVSSPAELLYII